LRRCEAFTRSSICIHDSPVERDISMQKLRTDLSCRDELHRMQLVTRFVWWLLPFLHLGWMWSSDSLLDERQ
jgi:hypothetical protein